MRGIYLILFLCLFQPTRDTATGFDYSSSSVPLHPSEELIKTINARLEEREVLRGDRKYAEADEIR